MSAFVIGFAASCSRGSMPRGIDRWLKGSRRTGSLASVVLAFLHKREPPGRKHSPGTPVALHSGRQHPLSINSKDTL